MSGAVTSLITGTGSYLPEKVMTNDDLAGVMETSDEWIRKRTGIAQRHIAAEGEEASDLACHAAREAITAAGLDVEAPSARHGSGHVHHCHAPAIGRRSFAAMSLTPPSPHFRAPQPCSRVSAHCCWQRTSPVPQDPQLCAVGHLHLCQPHADG